MKSLAQLRDSNYQVLLLLFLRTTPEVLFHMRSLSNTLAYREESEIRLLQASLVYGWQSEKHCWRQHERLQFILKCLSVVNPNHEILYGHLLQPQTVDIEALVT